MCTVYIYYVYLNSHTKRIYLAFITFLEFNRYEVTFVGKDQCEHSLKTYILCSTEKKDMTNLGGTISFTFQLIL